MSLTSSSSSSSLSAVVKAANLKIHTSIDSQTNNNNISNVNNNNNNNNTIAAKNPTDTLALLFDKAVEKLNSTRRDCKSERLEIINNIKLQLHKARTEAIHTQNTQQQLQREVRALQEKLQSAAIHHSLSIYNNNINNNNNNNNKEMHELTKVAQQLQRDTQQALSEVELLKTAIFHTQLTREEETKVEETENEEIELRLQQTEASNNALHAKMRELQTQNQQLTQILENILLKVQHNEASEAYQQEQIHFIFETFHQMQKEHTHLTGIVESLTHNVEQYKVNYDETLRHLEKLVIELEEMKSKNKINNNINNSKGILWFNENSLHNHQNIESVNNDINRPLQQRLEQFYKIYNPEKLSSVGVIIDEYMGAEEELMAALEVHYGAFGFFSHH